MRFPRGKWWDILFALIAVVLGWLVFTDAGAAILAMEVGL